MISDSYRSIFLSILTNNETLLDTIMDAAKQNPNDNEMYGIIKKLKAKLKHKQVTLNLSDCIELNVLAKTALKTLQTQYKRLGNVIYNYENIIIPKLDKAASVNNELYMNTVFAVDFEKEANALKAKSESVESVPPIETPPEV